MATPSQHGGVVGPFPPLTKQGFPRLSAIASQVFEKELLKRIKDARSGPIRLAFADLFVGPTVGRLTELKNLRLLCGYISSPSEYQTSSALLAVKGLTGMLKGKLLVVGGGHRLVVSTRRVHLALIPYQLVELADLVDLHDEHNPLKQVHAVLTVNVETTEPRPHKFPMMQQVSLYADLKEYFQWKADEFYRRLDTKPRSLTQGNLIDMYEEFKKLPGPRAKSVLEFMTGMKKNSMFPLMLGADRLLEAKVVPYLCHLEALGCGRFCKQSLNIVRSWNTRQIRDQVADWKQKREQGIPFTAQFTTVKYSKKKRKSSKVEPDTISHKRRRTRTASKKSKKSKPSTNSKKSKEAKDSDSEGNASTDNETSNAYAKKLVAVTLPPHGWESYINWSQVGSISLLDQLQKKIQERIRARPPTSKDKSASGVISIVDDHTPQAHLRIVETVRKSLDLLASRRTTRSGETCPSHEATFDIGKLISEAVANKKKEEWKDVVLKVKGGAKQSCLDLKDGDIAKILNLDWASDDSVRFTLLFLTNWTREALCKIYVLDSFYSSGWLDTLLVLGEEPLLSLDRRVRTYNKSFNVHHPVWTKDISILPLCGKGHWTLAVVVHLPLLLQHFESESESSPECNPLAFSGNNTPDRRPTIIFLDSCSPEFSSHTRLVPNILHYLAAAYPGNVSVTFDMVQEAIHVIQIRKPEQKKAECGFYVTYHAALTTRNLSVFLHPIHSKIDGYLKRSYKDFLFATYCDLVHVRLNEFLNKYDAKLGNRVHSKVFLWDPSDVLDHSPDSTPKAQTTTSPPTTPIIIPSAEYNRLLPNHPSPQDKHSLLPSILTQAHPTEPFNKSNAASPKPQTTSTNADSDHDALRPKQPSQVGNNGLPPVLTQVPSALGSGASSLPSNVPPQISDTACREGRATGSPSSPSRPPVKGDNAPASTSARPITPSTSRQSQLRDHSVSSVVAPDALRPPQVSRADRATKRPQEPSLHGVEPPPKKRKTKLDSQLPFNFTTAVADTLVHIFKNIVPGFETQVQAVFEEPVVKLAVQNAHDPSSLKDIVTNTITPMLLDRLSGAAPGFPPHSTPQPLSTTVNGKATAVINSPRSTKGFVKHPPARLPVTLPTFTEIVTQGDTLIQSESDAEIRKEWMELQLRSTLLLTKMKSRK